METAAITDEMDAVGAWARGALEFKIGERTPVQVVYRKYVNDCETSEKEYVGMDEFSKRMKRCFEIKQARHTDVYNVCSRIINYKLK